MPAETFGVETAMQPAFDRRRRSERRGCTLDVTVRTSGGDLAARLLDVSAGGFGLTIATIMALKPGARIAGPAIIEEPTTTIVVYPGLSAELSPAGNYILNCG